MAEIITATAGYKYLNSTGSDIIAGQAVVNGGLFGFAAATIQAGATGWIETFGVWKVECANTETASLGDIAYWDATNGKATATASTNIPIGRFVKAITSGDTTCDVVLIPSVAADEGSGSGSGG